MTWRRLRALYEYRDLLLALADREIRVRYKQAAMGVAWAFFLPALALGSGVMVRGALAVFSGDPLDAPTLGSVAVRATGWLFFSTAVGSASMTLIGNTSLVTRVYFPREVLPLSALLARLFDFGVSLLFVVLALGLLALVGDGQPVHLSWSLLLVPPLIAVLVALTASLALLLAAANVFFRDVKYVVEILLRFGIFFSGVYVFAEDLPPRLATLMLLNPVTPLLEALGDVVTTGTLAPSLLPWLALSTAVAAALFAGATIFYQRLEPLFAEYI